MEKSQRFKKHKKDQLDLTRKEIIKILNIQNKEYENLQEKKTGNI